MLFTADIVGATRASEDPHNICLSEPLAPIMNFPTIRETSLCKNDAIIPVLI